MSEAPDVPFFGSARENAEIEAEAGEAFVEVLRSGRMLQSRWVEDFEQEIARRAGREHAVAVGSATDALFFALTALGIGPGDEVLVTDLSFVASASCIADSKWAIVAEMPHTIGMGGRAFVPFTSRRTMVCLSEVALVLKPRCASSSTK